MYMKHQQIPDAGAVLKEGLPLTAQSVPTPAGVCPTVVLGRVTATSLRASGAIELCGWEFDGYCV